MPRIVRYDSFLWVIILCFTSASFTWVAARILPKDFSCSRSDGGQIQGSIGAVISHSNRTVFFFLSARYLASFAARIVFPLPGLPQTAKTPPCRIPSSVFSSVFRAKILFFLKFSNLFHLALSCLLSYAFFGYFFIYFFFFFCVEFLYYFFLHISKLLCIFWFSSIFIV